MNIRNDAALSVEEYKEIKQTVVDTPFNNALSGRQVVPSRKVSEGRQSYEFRTLSQTGDAELIAKGTNFPGMAINKANTLITIPKIALGFEIFREDLLSSRTNGEALNVSEGRMCAKKVDIKENDLIWNGSSAFGITGIYDSAGKSSTGGGDWSTGTGTPYNDVRAAAFSLDEEFIANTGVFNPTQFGELFTRESNTQRLYIELINDGLKVDCFKDSAMTTATALVFERSAENAEVVVAEERQLEESYEATNQAFRFGVFVRSVPVVYQANAFCQLTNI